MADWGTIAQVGASLFNTGAQVHMNKKNRQYALDDWHRQNAYNAPAQQMQRFKEAGLNPNLIYKQTNEAAPVRSTDYVAPQLGDFQGILSKSNQMKIQDQQLSNMELQNEAIQAQIAKTKADALFVASNTDYKNLDIKRLQGQLPGLVEGVMLRNEKYKAEIANTIAETQNKVAQLPIHESNKKKIDLEIEKLFKSNKYIKLEKDTQLSIQRIMISNMKVLGDNMRRQGVTEGMKQELIQAQIQKMITEMRNLRNANIKDFDFDDVIGILKLFK
jgi:uncharacterized transporter YbjL